MFGFIANAVDNAIDVVTAVVTLDEYGEFSKKTVSKMVEDGVELYMIASFFGVGTDEIKEMIG